MRRRRSPARSWAAARPPAISTTTGSSTSPCRTPAVRSSSCTTAATRTRGPASRLRGTRSNREGIGAVLILETDRGTQVREVKSGGSYLSSSDPRVVFGLGTDAKIRKLEIRWPSGAVQTLNGLALRKYTVVTEP